MAVSNSAPRLQDSKIVAVIGPDGSGKTTFISLLQDANVDMQTDEFQTTMFELAGQTITLIDTPGYGFHDAHHLATQDDILKEIAVFMSRTYGSRKLDGMIYVHRISDRPQGGISKHSFRRFQRICNISNVAIAMWDDKRGDDEGDGDLALARNIALFQDALDSGAQRSPYNGTAMSAKLILTRFLDQSPEVDQLRRDLEVQPRPISWRTAAASIETRLAMQEQRHQQDMEVLRRTLERDTAQREVAYREEAQRSINPLQLRLAQMEAENRRLAAEVERGEQTEWQRESTLKELQSDNKKLAEEIANARARAIQADRSLAAMDSAVTRLTEELTEAKMIEEEMGTKLAAVKSENGESTENVALELSKGAPLELSKGAQAAARSAEMEVEKGKLEEEIKGAKDREEQLVEELAVMRSKIATLAGDSNTSTTALEARMVAALREKDEALQRLCEESTDRYLTLRQQLTTAELERDQLRDNLEATTRRLRQERDKWITENEQLKGKIHGRKRGGLCCIQ